MKPRIQFTFEGKLIGKGRPKFGKGFVYTPERTRTAERELGYLAADAMRKASLKPLCGPVGLFIDITVSIPKSWPQKRKDALKGAWVVGRPDLDNCGKLAGDAFNGIVFIDDSQIARLSIYRRYGDVDKAYFEVEEL